MQTRDHGPSLSPFCMSLWHSLFFIMFAHILALPASALDHCPGVFLSGVFTHLYLCEQQSCLTRVKIQQSLLWNFSQNVSVLVNPPSLCLFYKFSKTTWNHKHSASHWIQLLQAHWVHRGSLILLPAQSKPDGSSPPMLHDFLFPTPQACLPNTLGL
jgi:hypothetical protein